MNTDPYQSPDGDEPRNWWSTTCLSGLAAAFLLYVMISFGFLLPDGVYHALRLAIAASLGIFILAGVGSVLTLRRPRPLQIEIRRVLVVIAFIGVGLTLLTHVPAVRSEPPGPDIFPRLVNRLATGGAFGAAFGALIDRAVIRWMACSVLGAALTLLMCCLIPGFLL
jgi:hypothetical protein